MKRACEYLFLIRVKVINTHIPLKALETNVLKTRLLPRKATLLDWPNALGALEPKLPSAASTLLPLTTSLHCSLRTFSERQTQHRQREQE